MLNKGNGLEYQCDWYIYRDLGLDVFLAGSVFDDIKNKTQTLTWT